MTATRLGDLFAGCAGVSLTDAQRALVVTDVCDHSAAVTPGALFVAVPGTHRDGATFVPEAIRRGAVAVVSETDSTLAVVRGTDNAAGVTVVRVNDARSALAHLAAARHGFPAQSLDLVGITGTIGKTSVLTMLLEILDAAGIRAGGIGSLGMTYAGQSIATDNTTPGILTLQRALAEMKRRGAAVAAMEVTSHALVQQRVRGLRYGLGIFTNLRMLEHMEFHDTFDDYASAKLHFFDHLEAGAPLVYAAGDRAVKQAVRRHRGPRISCGGGPAWVGIRRDAVTLRGSRLTLRVRRPLPRRDGSCFAPAELAIQLRIPGRSNIVNAALAAVAGLCLGAAPAAVQSALARIEPPPRRLQVLMDSGPIVIDDTVGHPDSISAVCEVVERVPHGRVRTVFCVRGRRGAEINRQDAQALAVWARRLDMLPVLVTSAADTADERNAVSEEERAAFLSVLSSERVAFEYHERLDDAIGAALHDVAPEDVVLLLGAQGMDAGASLVRRHISMR